MLSVGAFFELDGFMANFNYCLKNGMCFPTLSWNLLAQSVPTSVVCWLRRLHEYVAFQKGMIQRSNCPGTGGKMDGWDVKPNWKQSNVQIALQELTTPFMLDNNHESFKANPKKQPYILTCSTDLDMCALGQNSQLTWPLISCP